MALFPLGLIVFGGSIRAACHRKLGRMFTWEASILKDHSLITTGPYRFVRHPSYAGHLCVMVGYFWYLNFPGTFGRECFIGSSYPPSLTAKSAFGIIYTLFYPVFNGDTIIFLIRRSFAEDAMMKRRFGKEWEEWASRVRWNVIPFVL
jgi:protein-S-isoprenylcysteine O-methyltransferase Ste14